MSGALIVPASVQVANTTLFHLATLYYGDPTLWTRIARANGLTDPWVGPITTLAIPRPDGRPGAGGILGDV